MGYDSSFTAGYDPSRTLNAQLQLGGLSEGNGLPGFDFNGLLEKAYWMKQRAANADAVRARDAIQNARTMQAPPTSTPQYFNGASDPYAKYRIMHTLQDSADRDMYSANGTRINRSFQNVPMAAAQAGVNMPDDGWTTYAKLASALSPQSAAAVTGTAGVQQQALARAPQEESDWARSARMYGKRG